MSTPLILACLFCLAGMVFSGVFSGVETGAYRFHRARHRLALARGSRRAQLVQALTRDMTGFVVVCLIGTNLANAIVSYSSTLALKSVHLPSPELLATLTVAPLLFVSGELFPKELFRRHADRLVYATAPLVSLSALVFWPLTRTLGLVQKALQLLGLGGDDEGGRLRAQERLRHAIAAGTEGGTLTDYQATLARNIFSLDTRTVAEVMIRLEDVDALALETPLDEARAFVSARQRTRYPVYRGQRDQIAGIVELYDLVFEEREGGLEAYLREPYALDANARVVDAIVRLRRRRTSLALVTRGERVIGIATLKDLVEEITGELTDL